MLKLLPENASRDALEVRVIVMFGHTLATLRGYLDPELLRLTERLQELSDRITDPDALYLAIYARWNVEFSRGNPRGAEEMARRLIAMVGDANDTRTASALQLLGVAQIWRGHPMQARVSFERAVELFSVDLEKSLFSMVDPVVPNRAHLAWAQWMCGYPEQALHSADEGVALALRLNRPFSIAFALQYRVSIDHLCRIYTRTTETTENLVSLARENGFPMWLACGTMSMGRMMVEGGDRERGFQLMREGLAQIREAGGELLHQFMRVLLAESCLVGGLNRRRNRRPRQGPRSHREIRHPHVGIGDLPDSRRVSIGSRAMIDPLSSQFREALRIARAQEAKGWELRAATSLARLMIEQSRRDEARTISNRYTPGSRKALEPATSSRRKLCSKNLRES